MSRILLVEDNEVALRTMTLILEKGGHSVIKATDGREALEKLYNESIDIVVADILLPHLTGLEMLSKVRDGHFKNDIGIILVTSLADESTKVTAFKLGADDYLQKPFSMQELTSRVETLLAKRQLYSLPLY